MADKVRAAIYTLGCKVNQYESRAIAEALANAGAEICPFETACDLYVINTCAVTAESDRKSRQFVRRAAAMNPEAVIAVLGCSSQLNAGAMERIARENACRLIVGGSGDKIGCALQALEQIRAGWQDTGSVMYGPSSLQHYDAMAISGFDRTRAYVKIEDGCESCCAYCIIPKVRGPVRSRPREDVLKEVRTLAEAGCHEVVLTGIETSAYDDLAGLTAAVAAVQGIERIRYGSMDPAALTPSFFDRIASYFMFAPHFHVSVQSGSDNTLRRMRRKYNRSMMIRNLEYIRQVIPEAQFSADVIVGFPGETESDFNETVSLVEMIGFLHLHIFPYSRRPGTEAADMPDQIPADEKNRRCTVLKTTGEKIRRRILDREVQCRTTVPVLIEEIKDDGFYGHSDNFVEYRIVDLPAKDTANVRGSTVMVSPVNHDGNLVTASALEMCGPR